MCYHIPDFSCAFSLAGIEGDRYSDEPAFTIVILFHLHVARCVA